MSRNRLFNLPVGEDLGEAVAVIPDASVASHCPSLSLGDGPKPQRSRMAWRKRSRSSGVIFPQRSRMRLRKLGRPERCDPNPPKRMRHRANSPSPCQKLSWRQPNSDGNSQFHRRITTSPPTRANSSIARIPNGAMKYHFFFMFGSSCFREFVVNTLQALAEMQHRVTFAREQRIHAHAGVGGHLLETPPFQLVSNKHLALLVRKLGDRRLEFVEKQVAGVERVRSGIGRR